MQKTIQCARNPGNRYTLYTPFYEVKMRFSDFGSLFCVLESNFCAVKALCAFSYF